MPVRAVRSVARAVRKVTPPVRRMPNPRLTGLGCGLFSGVAMFVLAGLDRLLFGASAVLYGVLFLLVSALSAVWVRGGDLASAPVVVPIAFAVGLPLLAEGEGGLGGHLMALVTALAMQAGWLYGGTLVAGVIVTVRKLRLMARRAGERERERGTDRDRDGVEPAGRVRVGGQVRGGAAGGRPQHPAERRSAGSRAPRPPAQPRRTVPRG
ncbi:hypothetical protein PV517_26810 [Streptomyces griseiscabiei]|uniref:DUF6542 domain-containing protein n=2 Tax=Streptomyces griseiscabiei TaxID=2993540 RepID=A0ABU4L957_9ACTN|nr:hypothetical protein [Streptomyces griseiscabiei]